MDPAARLRVLLLLAFLIVGTIFGVIRLALDMELSGRIDYTWIVVLVVIDGVIASFVILQIRSREIQFGEVQVRLASRAKEEGSAGAGWTLASFDNGLVMQGQRQGPIVSFYLCYDASRQRYAPTMAEIQEYTRGFGVMRPVQTISATKGDPSARALWSNSATRSARSERGWSFRSGGRRSVRPYARHLGLSVSLSSGPSGR